MKHESVFIVKSDTDRSDDHRLVSVRTGNTGTQIIKTNVGQECEPNVSDASCDITEGVRTAY